MTEDRVTHLPNDRHGSADWVLTRPPGQPILHNGSAGVRPALLALVGSCTLLATLVSIFHFSVAGATARSAIETAVIVVGLMSAWFIWVRCTRTRHVSHLLLFAAVLTLTLARLAFFAIPAMLGSSDYGPMVPMIAHVAIAVMFAAAALVRPCRVATRKQATFLLATPVVGAGAVAVAALLLHGDSARFGPQHPGSMTTAPGIALIGTGLFLMLVAAVGFVRPVLRQRNTIRALPGAAAILLAEAWSYPLLAPGQTAISAHGSECLCAGAFGLILLFAFKSYEQLQRALTDEAVALERRRLVCDLHDGMAQDLAFIATYAERLVQDFGPDHPLAVAARRALAASRGVIADVSASDAPSSAAALRAVARELSIRHGVDVTVEADGGDLNPSEREAVVRIAREAIVNAVQHGHARHIAVELDNRDEKLALRISDDGRGLGNGAAAEPHRGLGLGAMRQRTEAIGGHLTVDERPDGGTAVQAVVS